MLEAATALFAERGYEATTFAEVAKRADVSVGLSCRYFPTKEHLALALYGSLADALAADVRELPAGTLAERFVFAMEHKLRLLAPHRRALAALVARALDPSSRAAVLGAAAAPIRAQVLGVFSTVVSGASDAPEEGARGRVADAVYALHLALVFAWAQDASENAAATHELLALASEMLGVFGPMLGNPHLPLAARLTSIARSFLALPPSAATPSEKPHAILDVLFRRRRLAPGVAPGPIDVAMAPHLPRVASFVSRGERVRLALPAFPAKSPNPEKVLGKRPDMAERLGLEALVRVLKEIEDVYPPGAELVLCSDGGVFADLVGVSDADVAKYRADLEEMIGELDTDRVRFFGLEDALAELRPQKARIALMERYGQSVEALRARAKVSPSQAAMIDGIHRFLTEDERGTTPGLSRSQAQKRTRERAYEVVTRSEAWGRLVGSAFPDAIRLSIHPQPDVSEKIGIHLVETADAWLTPWHGVALRKDDRFSLVRRAEAEALGAHVVVEDGRPSHFEIGPEGEDTP